MPFHSGQLLLVAAVIAFMASAGSLIEPDQFRVSAQGLTEAVATVKPAVVFVNVILTDGRQASGSGFLIHPDGYILTARHVVVGARKVFIRLNNGSSQEARVMGVAEEADTALLKIPGSGYPFVALGDPLQLRQGEEVLVLGYPGGQQLGVEDVTVTRGIVSAFRVNGLVIQIDAAINPGNSGGPVVNGSGLAVGIAFARSPRFTGVNFAVSIVAARSLVSTIPGGLPGGISVHPPGWAPLQPSTPYFPADVSLSRDYSLRSVDIAYPLKEPIVNQLRVNVSTSRIESSKDKVTVMEMSRDDSGRSSSETFTITSSGIFREHAVGEGGYGLTDRYMSPDLVLPLPAEVGRSWQVRKITEGRGGVTVVEETWQVSRVKFAHSTPAGEFDDCVYLTGVRNSNSTEANQPGKTTQLSQVLARVFCSGVGLVYYSSGFADGSYTFEQVLVAYSTR